jgi:hypothetical protein
MSMPNYRKKPIVIEAYQYLESSFDRDAAPRFIQDALRADVIKLNGVGQYYIETPEGTLFVADGDWIIQGVECEIYPCKPSVFDATYDLVAE